MSALIGIDLGTSTTEAAVYRNGAPEMILNLDGEVIVPSAVGIDEAGNWVTGSRAMAQYLLSPEKTAIEVKRKTGSGERIQLGKTAYTPAELQEKLLSYVRHYASEYLGEDVNRAVISVPAYFDQEQRAETIAAGENAGFQVERILNEPTAAAMSYGLEHMDENSHILVYDLGGGTFDVTLLEMFSGVLEVKASSGDNLLGGKDFDACLMDELLRRFRKKHGIDLQRDRHAAVRLRTAAEACKIALSDTESYRVLLPAICVQQGSPLEMDETITRKEFEKLSETLMKRTHTPLDVVLKDAKIQAGEIDQIILVGGSTRMPMVARDIETYLKKKPEKTVHPDYAVAMGAAIQAGIISGEIDPSEGLVMTDVSAFSLGVCTEDERGIYDSMSVVIPRNITIPVQRTENFSPAADHQTQARIDIYQGESRYASHNRFLGQFMIKGIPPKMRGQEKLAVTFAYDLNGMLKVTAQIVSTGKMEALEIDMKKARKEKPRTEDLSRWKDAPGARTYRTLIRTAERKLSQEETSDFARQTLQLTLDGLKQSLIEEKPEEAERAGDILRRLLEGLKE